ncbi:MAG: cytochrome d ubiquinol oxidase subunit II, partial [Anaerolineales bacterium]|nr:cytochrome d ubiquinol oxidase subunit II [Anaerolineales bacterium]
VAFANLVRGVPIDADMNYVGSFFTLLNPYALLGGIALVLVCIFHGAIFLSMKTTGAVLERAQRAASRFWLPVVLVLLVFMVATYMVTDVLARLGINPGIVPISAMVAMLLAGYFIRKVRFGWAFIMSSITILAAFVTMFMILYPRVMISSLNPLWSLTIYNASSSPYTLQVMTIIAVIFVPVMLIYQGWSYYIFRKRVAADPQTLTY